MKLAALFLFALRVSSLALPDPESDSNRLTAGTVAVYSDSSNLGRSDSLESSHELAKRRGGGGGGGGGGRGGGGSSSGGSSGGRTGSSSGSSGSSSSSSSSGRTSSSGNKGGSSRSPSYAGGGGSPVYSGGGAVAYTSGDRRKKGKGNITPVLLGAGVAAGLFGAFALGAYAYDFGHHYTYLDPETKKNVTRPVKCLCERYGECGCEDNDNAAYYKSVFGGDVPKNNSVVKVADYKGNQTIFIDGSLPNGTTANGASALSGGSPITLLMTFIMVTGMVWFI